MKSYHLSFQVKTRVTDLLLLPISVFLLGDIIVCAMREDVRNILVKVRELSADIVIPYTRPHGETCLQISQDLGTAGQLKHTLFVLLMFKKGCFGAPGWLSLQSM